MAPKRALQNIFGTKSGGAILEISPPLIKVGGGEAQPPKPPNSAAPVLKWARSHQVGDPALLFA